MSAVKEPETLNQKVNQMKSKILMSAAAAVLALSGLVGCSTSPTNAQIGTGVGAVVGGVAGSALTGGSALGTVGGAAAGALIGNEVGKKR